jgi:hypothetical protein
VARGARSSVPAPATLAIVSIALATSSPRAAIAAAPSDLELAIERDNCPVYSAPVADDSRIVYTVHKGSRYAAPEPGHAAERRAFHRIRFGSREGDLGWVPSHCVRLVTASRRDNAPAAPAGPDLALLERIRRLVQAYNEERSELTRSYNLRPFPAFGVTLAPARAGDLYLPEQRVRVPLSYASSSRRLQLPRADKLLLQLVVREAFQTTPAPAAVEVELSFSAGAPVRLGYARDQWRQLGLGGIDDFWRGLTGPEKDGL